MIDEGQEPFVDETARALCAGATGLLPIDDDVESRISAIESRICLLEATFRHHGLSLFDSDIAEMQRKIRKTFQEIRDNDPYSKK